MEPLRKLTLEDKRWMDPIVLAQQEHSADFCFGNLFIWDEEYDQRVGFFQGRIIVKARAGTQPFFACPIGTGELRPVLEELHRYAAERGFPFAIFGVTEGYRAEIEAAMPGKFAFRSMEQYFDYVYETQKLATLSGKKLHGKRNHINRFEERYPDWHYEAMTPAHFDACRSLLAAWQSDHAGDDGTVAEENTAILRTFRHFDALGMEGGVLFAGGRLCAFTMGELCAHDTYLVHYEKADAEIEGAYPMINREFARQIQTLHPEAVYLNREDDMGLDSLRQSKRSYHPALQVVKYAAHWIGDAPAQTK